MSFKLKLGRQPSIAQDGSGSAPGSASSPPPPNSTGGGGIKLKLSNSQPPTPASETAGSTFGSGAFKKPAAKKSGDGGSSSSKKRAAEHDISPNPKRPAGPSHKISLKLAAGSFSGGDSAPPSAASLNKIRLGAQRKPSTPKIRSLNFRRPPPKREPGKGYDSEDSEAEEDPAIHQGFVLRMQPGEDCEYVRDAIANGKIGLPASEGPAEVSLRFLDKDFRRAIVKVRGRLYAAALVDLPCIVETMKSWDKKGWWKVADVCQMLLVLGRCTAEAEALNYALPKEVDKTTMQYAHGLTPPMHWVRKHRFRKRLSYKTIANVEEEVERMLKEDEAAADVKWEIHDRAEMERAQYNDDDAEGEPVETVERDGYNDDYSEDDADLEGNLQAMFDEDASVSATAGHTPQKPVADQAASMAAVENAMTESVAATPAVGSPMAYEEEDEEQEDDRGDSSSDDEDEEDAPSPDVMDADALAQAAERTQQMEEVADLEREVASQRQKVGNMKNLLLRERAVAQLRILEQDLRVKKGVLGFEEED